MRLPHQLESRLGGIVLAGLRGMQRRALGVDLGRHVDARARVTPILRVGTPRRGTLVWLHGFSDRFDTILQVAKHLRHDYEIIAPSMPAFGEGWVDLSEVHTFARYADWMTEVVDSVVPGRFHLMGNSLGGATALGVAARLPERVHSLVLLNSAGVELDAVRCAHKEIADGDNLFEVRTQEDHRALGERVFFRPPKLPRWVDAHLFEESRSRADWYGRLAADLAKSEIVESGDGWSSYAPLSKVEAPTLVVWGSRDTLFPVAHAELLADRIAGARLELLDDVGHCAHLEDPVRLARTFSNWARSRE